MKKREQNRPHSKIKITISATTEDAELEKRLILAVDSGNFNDIVSLLGYLNDLTFGYTAKLRKESENVKTR